MEGGNWNNIFTCLSVSISSASRWSNSSKRLFRLSRCCSRRLWCAWRQNKKLLSKHILGIKSVHVLLYMHLLTTSFGPTCVFAKCLEWLMEVDGLFRPKQLQRALFVANQTSDGNNHPDFPSSSVHRHVPIVVCFVLLVQRRTKVALI